jgi:hypothetical protein
VATLTDDELARIKAEVFDNLLGLGAVPYFDVRTLYPVIRDNVVSSDVAATTSSTSVTSPGATTITLASATGYVAGQRIVLDVDDQRETVTIRSLSGAVASVVCRYTHSGTYPVAVESPLTLVRGYISDLITLEQVERGAFDTAGVRRVDEIEFFGRAEGGSKLQVVNETRNRLRAKLASALNLTKIMAEMKARSDVALGAGGAWEAY